MDEKDVSIGAMCLLRNDVRTKAPYKYEKVNCRKRKLNTKLSWCKIILLPDEEIV